MKRLSLVLGALALAAIPSTSALADTFSFTLTGGLTGSGTLVATDDGGGKYTVNSATGMINSQSISLIGANGFDSNDNFVYDNPGYNPGVIPFSSDVDYDGISFLLGNGSKVNVDLKLGYFVVLYAYQDGTLDPTQGRTTTGPVDFDITNTTGAGDPPAPAPEPSSLVLLGTGILGAAGAVRRRMKI
jgi:hypothetical protein